MTPVPVLYSRPPPPIPDLPPPGRSAMVLKNHCRPYPIADSISFEPLQVLSLYIQNTCRYFIGKYSSFTLLDVKVLTLDVTYLNRRYSLYVILKEIRTGYLHFFELPYRAVSLIVFDLHFCQNWDMHIVGIVRTCTISSYTLKLNQK